MNRLLLIVLTAIFILPALAMANTSGLFSTAPTPVQQYQSGASKSGATTQPKTSTKTKTSKKAPTQKSQAQNMQKVKAIMAAAAERQSVTPNTQQAQPTTTQTSAKPSQTHKATKVAKPTLQNMQAEVSELNQRSLLIQQSISQRISQLGQENSVLQNKVNKLGQALSLLNRELGQEQKTVISKAQHPTILQGIANVLNIKVEYLLYSILVVLLIIVALLIPKRKRAAPELALATGDATVLDEESEDDTKDEFDFMNSNEAIPAKLDLARAYIAMEDYKAARTVIEQVQAKGNEQQLEQAQNLLNDIPEKS